MCGIFGYIGKSKKGPKIALEGLKRLEYRGYDSWGVTYKKEKNKGKSKGRFGFKKKVGKIGEAVIGNVKSSIALGHTRWATHGGVTIENTHPHFDCSGRVSVVHNGIIENFAELKKELLSKGHHFSSDTDSEVAAHLIEENKKREKNLLQAVRNSFLQLQGRNAVIVFSPEEEKLIAAKNGSPIVLGRKNKERYIASDAAALLPLTKEVLFLEDDNMAVLSKNKVEIFNIESGKKKKANWEKLTWDVERAQKGNYDHYYLKEVVDQRQTIREMISQKESAVRQFTDLIKKSYGTYLIGAGTASYACLSGVYIFSKIARKHINFISATEFPYAEHFIRPDSLVIAVSQSGETADVLEAVKSAQNNGARIGAMVNVMGSTLARTADKTLFLRAGPEKAVVATKSFTCMLAGLYLLAFTLMGEYKQGRKTMLKLADLVDKYLADQKNFAKAEKIAQKLIGKEHIFVIGRGLSYPIALETAIKIKESSYIHAEGYAGGELKHGPIALVEKGTPFIALVPNDETASDILSNVMEVKTRGAHIIGISPQRHEVFDDWLPVPDAGVANSIISILPGQILAYYLTVKLGLDPDKPRNLAKSVTVK